MANGQYNFQQCADLCTGHVQCNSIEYDPYWQSCYLNKESVPSAGQYYGQQFCSKLGKSCYITYRIANT